MLSFLFSLLLAQTCPCASPPPTPTPSPAMAMPYSAADPNYPDHSCDGYSFDKFPPLDADGSTAFTFSRQILVSAKNTVHDDGIHFYVTNLDDGAKLLRSGRNDALLFNRGEIFDGNFGVDNKLLGAGGQDSTHPMVIGAYGSGARPILNFTKGTGLLNLLGSVSNLAVVSLDLEAPMNRSVDYSAIRMVARSKNILFEDLKIAGFTLALNLDLADTAQNFLIRRSQLLDAYTASNNGPYSFGIYAARVAGLTMDELVLDHNGWKTRGGVSTSSIYTRNAYIQSDTKCVTFSRSFSMNSSAEGIEMKSGGTMADNFYGWNPLIANYGESQGGSISTGIVPRGVSGSVERNVAFYSANITATLPRSGGLQLANLTHVKVSDNLIAHQDGFNISANQGLGVHELVLYKNIVYDSNSKFMIYGKAFGPSTLIADGKGQSYLVNANGEVVVKDGATGIGMASGTKLSISDQGSLVMGNIFQKGPTDFLSLAGIAFPSVAFLNAQTQAKVFNDPMRDPSQYQAIGSIGAFVSHLRTHPFEKNWSAPSVNAWIRLGFQ